MTTHNTTANDTVFGLQAQLMEDKLKACIHCGMCLPVCPTYAVTGSEAESPRGRLYLMKDLLADRPVQALQQSAQEISPHLEQCLGCQACQTACPSGVEYGELLVWSRAMIHEVSEAQPSMPAKIFRQIFQRAFKRAIFRWVLPNRVLLKGLGNIVQVYQQSGLPTWLNKIRLNKTGFFKHFGAWDHAHALMPEVPKQYSPLLAGMQFAPKSGVTPKNKRVALFTGCVMDTFYNPVHIDTIEVLTQNGYHVVIPEQTCCGALAHHAGELDIAHTLAQRNIQTMLRANPDWIVLNSAGCGSSMRHYDDMLVFDPAWAEQAKVFSAKVIDILALLDQDQTPLAPMPQAFAPAGLRATYHAPCHLHHAQQVQEAPLRVLSQIPGVTWLPLAEYDVCCGSAGIYNLEQPELSEEILARKIGHLQQTQADVVVTGNPGCMLQVAKGLKETGEPMRVLHPVTLLAAAYRGQGLPENGLLE